jgi:hypothetical protein
MSLASELLGAATATAALAAQVVQEALREAAENRLRHEGGCGRGWLRRKAKRRASYAAGRRASRDERP